MKQYKVVLQAEAEDDLQTIGRYLTERATNDIAERHVSALLAQCERLTTSPRRGSPRPYLGRGVRSITYKQMVTIIYRVRGDTATVVGFFYRGRDLKRALRGR